MLARVGEVGMGFAKTGTYLYTRAVQRVVSKEGTGNFLVDRFEGWFTAVWRSYWPWLLFCGLSAAAFRLTLPRRRGRPYVRPIAGHVYRGANPFQATPGSAVAAFTVTRAPADWMAEIVVLK